MEEEIEELLKRKDDYDFAYGTQIYKPYTMSEKDWELIENLLTRYKQLEKENKELKRKSDRDEILQDISDDFIKAYKRNTIPKSKVKEKIEEINSRMEKYREYTEQGIETDVEWVDNVADRETVQVLQELLREE